MCLHGPLRDNLFKKKFFRNFLIPDLIITYINKNSVISKDEWNPLGLINFYKKFISKRKSLLKTIASPEGIQKRIDQNPGKMIILMKDYPLR